MRCSGRSDSEAATMTSAGILQIVCSSGSCWRAPSRSGAYMSRVFQGERTFLHPLCPAARGAHLQARRRPRRRGAALDAVYGGAPAFSVFAFLLRMRCSGCRGSCRSIRRSSAGKMTPDLAFNTAVSFMTNTNWQAYARRGDAQLSRADGRAGGAELRFGGRRHRGGDCADPRLCAHSEPNASATSGWT